MFLKICVLFFWVESKVKNNIYIQYIYCISFLKNNLKKNTLKENEITERNEKRREQDMPSFLNKIACPFSMQYNVF